MTSRRPGGFVRPLEEADLGTAAALFAAAHWESSACAEPRATPPGDRALALGWEEGGALTAAGWGWTWGRVGVVHALAVEEGRRGRGVGSALLDALVDELMRRDAAVIGLEAPLGSEALTRFLADRGLRPGPPSFVLERELEAAGEGDETADQESVEGEADGPPEAVPPEVELVPGVRHHAGAAAATASDDVSAVAASLDADLDPGPWLADAAGAGRAELLWLDQPARGFAVVAAGSDAPAAPGALALTMTCVDEAAPFDGLSALTAAAEELARRRGMARVVLAAPSRSWDAVRHLLAAGFRPRRPALRLTRPGFPERTDLRRACLVGWR